MQGSDLLIVSAEISVAFAGFAGIISTFRFGNHKAISRGNYVGLSLIVGFGLSGAFFSLLPLTLSLFEIVDTTIWAVSSMTAGLFCVYALIQLLEGARASVMKPKTRVIYGLLFIIGVLLIMANFANSAGFIFKQEPGPLVAIIMFGHCLVGFMFSRLLLLPLRKSIDTATQEKESISI